MPDWEEIVERYGRGVWQTAYRLLGNRADADDCFQDAFLGAIEVSRRHEVQHWPALLKRLATARALDRLRLRYRHGSRAESTDWDALAGPAAAPSRAVEDGELSERLRAALACLPPKQPEVFCLHHLDDWSYQEIACHLEISIDSVGVLLHRARNRLRELLREPDSAPPAPAPGHTPVSGPVGLPKETR
jgi:RNA polymerase sigma-70 factor (ECF subfamily)